MPAIDDSADDSAQDATHPAISVSVERLPDGTTGVAALVALPDRLSTVDILAEGRIVMRGWVRNDARRVTIRYTPDEARRLGRTLIAQADEVDPPETTTTTTYPLTQLDLTGWAIERDDRGLARSVIGAARESGRAALADALIVLLAAAGFGHLAAASPGDLAANLRRIGGDLAAQSDRSDWVDGRRP